MSIDSVISIEEKVVSMFETKEKTIDEIAHEKAEHDKKVAEDQIMKLSEAVSKASSDASKKIDETATGVKSGVDSS